MRKATRTTAIWLGIPAGLAGLEHGVFEMLRGNEAIASLMFPSMGPPCDPEIAWNGCEPALSILPTYLAAGMVTVVISLIILVWLAFGISRRYGGVGLAGLSVLLLLAGGGIFPPLIGFIGGVAGMKIHTPIRGNPSRLTRLMAKLWPWPLVILVVWLLLMFPVGMVSNDFMASIMGFGMLLILIMLPLAPVVARAKDAVAATAETS